MIFYFKEAAGFTEEWSSNLDERVARRQIEVQASTSDNANRSTNYRTVTAQDSTGRAIGSSMTEAQEEREFVFKNYCCYLYLYYSIDPILVKLSFIF